MGKHSVAEAKNHLSKLIDLALQGERVVITRHGRAVVSLKPEGRQPRPMSPLDLEWLKAQRVTPIRVTETAGELVSRMRDEEDGRLS